MSTDRRTFLQLLSTGAFAAAFEGTIRKALAVPAHHRTGTIQDVEHIVVLMQENRSFDHYFGTMKGVRGFGDPRAVKLPSGAPGWNGSTSPAPAASGWWNTDLPFGRVTARVSPKPRTPLKVPK